MIITYSHIDIDIDDHAGLTAHILGTISLLRISRRHVHKITLSLRIRKRPAPQTTLKYECKLICRILFKDVDTCIYKLIILIHINILYNYRSRDIDIDIDIDLCRWINSKLC